MLAISVAALFAASLSVRAPLTEQIKLGHLSWLSASTAKFARSWLDDGPLALRFALVENPRSIEFPTLASRTIYTSYPPGAVVPVYLLALAEGTQPIGVIVSHAALLVHFGIGLALAFLAYRLARQAAIGPWPAAFGALTAPLLVFYLPGPLAYHEAMFFSDQCVLLPAALLLLLEGSRDPASLRTRSEALIAAVVLAGVLTDWFFFFLILTLGLARLVSVPAGRGWVRRATSSLVSLVAPALLGLGAFLLQMRWLGGLSGLYGRARWRSVGAPTDEGLLKHFDYRFWKMHAVESFGKGLVRWLVAAMAAVVLLWAIGLLLRRLGRTVPTWTIRAFSLALAASAGCLLQIYTFRQHSAVHPFSALKLELLIALLPFVILPLTVAGLARVAFPALPGSLPAAALLLGAVLGAVQVLQMWPRRRQVFPIVSTDPGPVPGFVRSVARFEDVVFSPELSIEENPPTALAVAGKRVYRARSLAEARALLAGRTQPTLQLALLWAGGCSRSAVPAGAEESRLERDGILWVRLTREASSRVLSGRWDAPLCR